MLVPVLIGALALAIAVIIQQALKKPVAGVTLAMASGIGFGGAYLGARALYPDDDYSWLYYAVAGLFVGLIIGLVAIRRRSS